MSRRRIRACALSGLLVLVFVFLIVSANELDRLPTSCFVVHCEPTRANEPMFAELTELVALADRFSVPLTIDFTAQWAEMILAADEKLAVVSRWLDAGHEIGGHHHAYWATLDRGSQWDGYTSTTVSALLPADRERYRGTMADYMEILSELPGERTSACMGLSDDRDLGDWPCELGYGTSGHTLEDAASEPYRVDYGTCEAWQISHGLILQEQGTLPTLYEQTGEDKVFVVVGHVYNFAEDPRLFEFWFRYLHAQDSEGANRRTVTEAIEERVFDGP